MKSMNLLAIGLCVLCQLLVVVSQIFFKHAMAPAPGSSKSAARLPMYLGVGIAMQAAWFFLWIGLLAKWELSRIFPFQGLTPVMVLLAAWLLLRERIPPSAWVGIALITAGIVIVSQS